MPHYGLSASATAARSPGALLLAGWRAIPPSHFAIAILVACAWGLANALGWWIGGGSSDFMRTGAHFVYESLLTMLLLAVGIGIADAATRDDPNAVAPYAIAAIAAAILGGVLFMLTAPLLGLESCACSMDRWRPGARTANMLPDSFLICGFVTAGYRYWRRAALRLARLNARELERAQLTRRTLESRLQAMQACIEPQFLFDTLAAVERLHASDPRTAVRLIDELIVYLRAALPHLRESTSTVAKETELAHAWLNIQRLRHGRGPEFAIDVGAGAEGASMSPMVLLPLVDYFVGDLAQASADCALRITVTAREGRVLFALAGNGIAGPAAESGPDKLAGLRVRLHTLYGEDAHLALGADARSATRITWIFRMSDPSAIIAEDEPVLRGELREMLASQWPELAIRAEVGDGQAAIRAVVEHAPSIVFLDIEMPGMTGLEVARQVSGKCHVVFVTAYDKYAVAAFEQGAVDYVMKPFTEARLDATIVRLKSRLAGPPADLTGILKTLANTLSQRKDYLRWITAAQGDALRLITVDEICYFKADHKYTLVVTPDSEALIRRPLKALAEEVDPQTFWQIHRSAMVNVKEIAGVDRDFRGHLTVKLKQRKETLPVGENYVHLFKQM